MAAKQRCCRVTVNNIACLILIIYVCLCLTIIRVVHQPTKQKVSLRKMDRSEHKKFTGVQVTGAQVTGAQVTGAQVTGVQVTGAQYTEAQVNGVQVNGAHVNGVQVTGAQVTGAQVNGAQVTGAQVTGAQVTGAQVTGAQFTGAQVTGAQVTGAQVNGEQVNGAQVNGAQVTRAQVTGAQVNGAQVNGAHVTGALVTGAHVKGVSVISSTATLTDTSVVIYNRVPKCGSTTLLYLTKILSEQNNNFTVKGSTNFYQCNITAKKQLQLIMKVQAMPKPLFYDRHVHFINFSKFGYDMPVYINLIRDPLSRFTSKFYYVRQYHESQFTEYSRNLSINRCIELNYAECRAENMFNIIPFFCGQESYCREPGEKALEKAEQNVVDFYAIVGITEEYLLFLKVLERILPLYFSGIVGCYNEMPVKVRVSVHREEISPQNRAYLMAQGPLRLEYEFYEFIRERLDVMGKLVKK